MAALTGYLKALDAEATAKEKLKAAEEALNTEVASKYGKLTTDEIQTLVINDKWLYQVAAATGTELQRLSSTLAGRLEELATRYEVPMPLLVGRAQALTASVSAHLQSMGHR